MRRMAGGGVGVALVLAVLLVAACGKRGAPAAPGPASEIIFPKTYPSR